MIRDADGRRVGLVRVWFAPAATPHNKPLKYVESRWGDDWAEVCCPVCGTHLDALIEPHSWRIDEQGTRRECPGPPYSDLCDSAWFGIDTSPHLACAEECYCSCHVSACCCSMIDDAPLGIVVCPKHGLLTRPKEN